ncbi:MAG TPA: AtpZ/AtpI family protein [Beijerinckiaceae bacterium]|nr:AtpZ/AtpI family protein [Beijerinckiaceae bacterium]
MDKDGTSPKAGEDALQARLDELTKALDAKRQGSEEAARSKSSGSDTGIGKAMGAGFRVASELAAAILVGGFLGWQLDLWFGSTPWFLMIFLILGIVAGFWNVYRLAAKPTGPMAGTDK